MSDAPADPLAATISELYRALRGLLATVDAADGLAGLGITAAQYDAAVMAARAALANAASRLSWIDQ